MTKLVQTSNQKGFTGRDTERESLKTDHTNEGYKKGLCKFVLGISKTSIVEAIWQ